MKAVLIMTTATVLALSGVLLGQSAAPDRSGGANPITRKSKTFDPSTKERYEDLEIMRLLLARKLAGKDPLRAYSGQMAPADGDEGLFAADTALSRPVAGDAAQGVWLAYLGQRLHNGAATSAAVEGVFLANKGAVFTVTLANSNRPVLATKAGAAPVAVSEWERTRQELRGQKPDEAAQPAQPQPSTADIILKLLAENGKNLPLRDDEDVSVVVTFRNWSTLNTFNPGGNALMLDARWRVADVAQGAVGDPSVAAQTFVEATQGTPPAAGHGNSPRDHELLGDLHQRQKQYAKAIEAYENALKQAPDDAHARELYRKLAENYLQLGRLEEARSHLDRVLKGRDEKKAHVNPTGGDTFSAKSALPNKLIISASKRLLDDAGSGKISFEDFKKSVVIDYVTFG